ncbi:hydrogenase nickel incorporation protein HypB [Mariprofundus erugo]|uniref:hydrogenase nickel incorporation protein HypB n=1 Tax=Mariprofundus erugo TaxID=2528639 RepID=UPI0010FEFB21|nr:hydrogenase nickel incorporation protein HypB [Mariprofundus erugo]TLS77133.1 hydrogenase nickel incorporation protein HypB [Mariprofundus erugo]
MCTVCGCGEDASHHHDHDHQGHSHHHGAHSHEHAHTHEEHASDHRHDYSQGAAGVHVAGFSQSRLISIEQDILSKNNRYADANRRWLNERGILALNLVSSPGAGKTTLLTKTIEALAGTIPVAVIEGDQQTANDAERIRATGVTAIQINTGKGCHLDGHMVGHAIGDLNPEPASLLFIENVGNLVCPAAFDLGEAAKVVILSVTEGADKPLKYPDMFHAASLMIIHKTDLLPYVDFDVDACCNHARRINPGIRILQLSATTGEGMEPWLNWLRAHHAIARIGIAAPATEESRTHSGES